MIDRGQGVGRRQQRDDIHFGPGTARPDLFDLLPVALEILRRVVDIIADVVQSREEDDPFV